MFGLPVPKEILKRGEPASYWGARAIFRPGRKNPIDLLPDRQTFKPQGVKKPMLLAWMNKTGLPWLREAAQNLDPTGSEVLTHTEGPYGLVACPNASYGYLYIGAWRYDGDKCRYELPAPTPGMKWSASFPVPEPGTRVKVNMNKMSTGTVLDYFHEHGYQGIRVELDNPPKWYKDQNGPDVPAMVFGIEVQLL